MISSFRIDTRLTITISFFFAYRLCTKKTKRFSFSRGSNSQFGEEFVQKEFLRKSFKEFLEVLLDELLIKNDLLEPRLLEFFRSAISIS
jgi:hypothetical protein